MKKIQFNNKKYDIPEQWSEVTLKQQIAVSEIADGEQYVKMLGILGGYTGIPVEELKHAKLNDVNRVLEHLKFLSTDIPEDPIYEFEFKGEKYYLHKNILEQEFQDYVSIQTAISEVGDKRWQATPFILAVMAKKEGETLDDINIRERAKEFEEIDVITANRITAFFLSNLRVSRLTSMLSSPKEQHAIVQSKWQELKDSLRQLRKQRGGNLLIRLWITILLKWTMYLERKWEKSFNSPVSKSSKKRWKTIYTRLPLMKRKQKVKINSD